MSVINFFHNQINFPLARPPIKFNKKDGILEVIASLNLITSLNIFDVTIFDKTLPRIAKDD